MSDPRRAADPDEPTPPTGHGTEKGRRRARWLLPLLVLVVIAVIVAYMLLVSRAG